MCTTPVIGNAIYLQLKSTESIDYYYTQGYVWMRVVTLAGTRSHNGETPSGRQVYIDLPGGIWQLEINSGFKWNVAFTIDLSQWYLPSFSGGHTQQYGGQKMAEYSVPNWKSYIKRYWFFDRDNSKKTWYVTIEEY